LESRHLFLSHPINSLSLIAHNHNTTNIDISTSSFFLISFPYLLFCSGHTNIVTGLSLNHNDTMLLSNSMDNSLRGWNVRAFSSGVGQNVDQKEQGAGRLEKMFLGGKSKRSLGLGLGLGVFSLYCWHVFSCGVLH